MKKQILVALFCCLFIVSAQHTSNARISESIEILDDETGRSVIAHLAKPDTGVAAVGVIVIHENQGLTDWVKSVADRLADNGYIAIAPDLLSGKGPNGGGTDDFASSDDARTAIGTLDSDQITRDLQDVTQYLREQTGVIEVSVSGFCWGGAQSFRYATNEASLAAAFVFYGTPPTADEISRIRSPIYGFYAENDSRINETIPATQEATESAGVTYAYEIYPGVGHAFLRSVEDAENPSEVEQASFDAAWTRFLDLLEAQVVITSVTPQGKAPTTLGEKKDAD